jgi:hypothetical protein
MHIKKVINGSLVPINTAANNDITIANISINLILFSKFTKIYERIIEIIALISFELLNGKLNLNIQQNIIENE